MEIEIQPYTWQEKTNKENQLELLAWAFDKDSNKCLLRVQGFPYFCRIEMPPTIGGNRYKWTLADLNDVYSSIKFLLGSDAPIFFKLDLKKRNLYHYDNYSAYITVFFHNVSSYRRCIYTFNNKKIKVFGLIEDEFGNQRRAQKFSEPILLRVWEQNDITPIIKLMANKKLENCNWMKCEAKLVKKGKISKLEKEYVCSFTTLEKIERDWVTSPRIASVDIETYSRNKLCFPNEWKTSDVVYMVNIYLGQLNTTERESHCVIMCDCNDVEGITIHRVKTQKELIYKMAEILNDYSPEFVLTYNGMGFDYKYLDVKLIIEDEVWPDMSLLKDDKTWVELKEWSSRAFTNNSHYIPHTSGMIHLDMMLIIKKAKKLNSYTLNFVANHYLKKTKHDLSAYDMFCIYENVVNAKKNYKKYKGTTEREKYAKILKKAVDEITKTVNYCEQDTILPFELFEFFGTYQDLIQSSSVFGVNPLDIFTKGAQCKGIAQVYNGVYNCGYVMNQVASTIKNYAGAYVFPPVPGKHKNVICLDFKSLYPSIIIANNLCWSTLIPKEKWSLYKPEDCIIKIIEQEEKINPSDPKCKEKHTVRHEVRFHKSKGLLPEILENLLSQRGKVRKLEAAEKDKLKRSVLTARQEALKVGANGLYGLCGMSEEGGGRLTCKEIAMFTTYFGRVSIQKVQTYVETNYNGELVYGDTDSGFISLGLKSPKDCLYWGMRLSHEISGGPEISNLSGLEGVTFPASKGLFSDTYVQRMQIEYEKGMLVDLLTKKRYASLIINKAGEYKTDKGSILHKGSLAAKRERCDFIKELYIDIVHTTLISDESVFNIIKFMKDRIKCLFDGKVDHNQMIEMKNMGKNYKQEGYALKVLSDRLIKVGKEMKPGSRMELVIVETDDPKDKVGKKYRLYEEYLDSLKTKNPYKLDYYYYIENLLSNSLDQVIGIIFKEEINTKYKEIQYKSGRCNPIFLDQPCKMLIKMMKDGESFNKIMKAMRIMDKK